MTVSSCAGWLDWQPVVKTEVASTAPNKHKQDFLKKGIHFPFVRRLEGTGQVRCKVYELRCQLCECGEEGKRFLELDLP
jgi:hypothetical protein